MAPLSPSLGVPVLVPRRAFNLAPPKFWRAFKFRILDGKEEITTDDVTGEPNYLNCGDAVCDLTGATVRMRFPAETIDAIPRVQSIGAQDVSGDEQASSILGRSHASVLPRKLGL